MSIKTLGGYPAPIYVNFLFLSTLRRHRFSDLLVDARSILPYPMYERDPTIDYNFNVAILYTMATCHSLKVVDGELLGDPLDVKMFEFTDWSYEEGSHTSDADEDSENFTPSVARAPPTLTPGDPEEGDVSFDVQIVTFSNLFF